MTDPTTEGSEREKERAPLEASSARGRLFQAIQSADLPTMLSFIKIGNSHALDASRQASLLSVAVLAAIGIWSKGSFTWGLRFAAIVLVVSVVCSALAQLSTGLPYLMAVNRILIGREIKEQSFWIWPAWILGATQLITFILGLAFALAYLL